MSEPPHPIPWRVEYDKLIPEWDDNVRPRVVDANGDVVVIPPQHVSHPGEYDEVADGICKVICASVNFVHGDDTEHSS